MKKGIAVPIVLIFATIMGIVSMFLFKTAKSYNKQNRISFAQLQAYYIARAGVQHAMLKVKYLHRELYDAICLSQGRNPLFDFSQIKGKPEDCIKTYNPGPIFLCKSSDNYGFDYSKGLFLSSFNSNATNLEKHIKWVKTFESDLNSVSKEVSSVNKDNSNEIIDIDKMPTDIKGKMNEPFKKAQYQVFDLGISASEVEENSDNIVDNNVVVEFTVRSTILTAKEEPFDYEIKKTIRVSRD